MLIPKKVTSLHDVGTRLGCLLGGPAGVVCGVGLHVALCSRYCAKYLDAPLPRFDTPRLHDSNVIMLPNMYIPIIQISVPCVFAIPTDLYSNRVGGRTQHYHINGSPTITTLTAIPVATATTQATTQPEFSEF